MSSILAGDVMVPKMGFRVWELHPPVGFRVSE